MDKPKSDGSSQDNPKSDGKYYDGINKCVQCGVDMGPQNPRQLCRKTYCENEVFNCV